MKNSITKRALALLLAIVCITCLSACNTGTPSESTSATTTAPTENNVPFVPGTVVKSLMVKELPAWATGKECKDVNFIIYDNGFEACLESAEVVSGTYEYDEMTGEYILSNGATLVETSEGYTYTNGNFSAALIDLMTKTEIGVLSGDTNILASGLYNMTITFNVTLYDDNTFVMSNLASPTVIEGTWAFDEATGTYSLTAEGLEVLECTGVKMRPSIKIKSSITGSDGNVYEFEVTVVGTVKG